MSKAEELIACLEGEIAKRDEELAACRVAVENCEVFRARVAELEARIVWLECELQVNAAPVSDAKAQGVVMPDTEDFCFCGKHVSLQMISGGASNYGYLGSVTLLIDGEYVEYTRLNAAPAEPAADAGLVDMYRHLQKVTPYRFKKIQDESITDGGDVMYFHKDRFDAALLADMAAHCAAKGVV